MITKNKIGLTILIAGMVVSSGYFLTHKKGKIDNLNPVVTVSPSLSPSPTNSPLSKSSGKDLQSLTPQGVEYLLGGRYKTVSYSQLTKPAACNIEGSINFLTHDTAVNYNPKISYTGIDSPARQIKWKIDPTDDLKVGPNLDASLELPDGESTVGVTLPLSPVSKNYNLTVSMTYGRLVNGEVIIHEVGCLGQIKVTLSY